jgi:spore coat protein U-like protein
MIRNIIVLIILFCQVAIAVAARCSFTTINGVGFGAYDVFSATNNNNGIGSITINCNGSGSSFVVKLSTGQSNTYASRVMRSGANQLNYNLYTSAARVVVWGDGTGGSSTKTISNKDDDETLTLFGQIPAAQDARVGIYNDSIIATVNF